MNAKWKRIIEGLAPTLAGVLGGPAAGLAVKYLSKAVLDRPDGTEDDLADFVLNADPEDLAKIRQADKDFKLEMRRLDIDLAKLSVEDRVSARGLFSVNRWPQSILSVFTLTIFGGILYFLFTHGLTTLDDWQKATIGMLLGVLVATVKQTYNFWMGSSYGSAEKNNMLNPNNRENKPK